MYVRADDDDDDDDDDDASLIIIVMHSEYQHYMMMMMMTISLSSQLSGADRPKSHIRSYPFGGKAYDDHVTL